MKSGKRFPEKFEIKNQEIRDKLFRPISAALTNLNITANLLSNLKLIIFLPFIIFALKNNFKIAFLFLLLSILVDLFDGPLARFQKKFSDRGKFVDIFGDFTIYLIVNLVLSYVGILDRNIVAYHLFIFPLITILSTIRKQEFTKTDWLIKVAPELGEFNALFYIFLFLYTFFNLNYLNFILILLNVYYSFLTIYYFIYVQARWLKMSKK